jgi:hypothetical protein
MYIITFVRSYIYPYNCVLERLYGQSHMVDLHVVSMRQSYSIYNIFPTLYMIDGSCPKGCVSGYSGKCCHSGMQLH